MRSLYLAAALSMGTVGCAASNGGPVEATAASVVGTPFLIALKIPVCASTIIIVGPLAAMSQLARPSSAELVLADGADPYAFMRQEFDEAVRLNCGPPYVVGL